MASFSLSDVAPKFISKSLGKEFSELVETVKGVIALENLCFI
jgi:hypothetical protein